MCCHNKKIPLRSSFCVNSFNDPYIYIYIYIYSKIKLATVVEGNLKALFSLAATTRCRGKHYFFPWIAPLYPRFILYNPEVSQANIYTFCLEIYISKQNENFHNIIHPRHSWAPPLIFWFPMQNTALLFHWPCT